MRNINLLIALLLLAVGIAGGTTLRLAFVEVLTPTWVVCHYYAPIELHLPPVELQIDRNACTDSIEVDSTGAP